MVQPELVREYGRTASTCMDAPCAASPRFLDRRFLLTLPSSAGERVVGYFGGIDEL